MTACVVSVVVIMMFSVEVMNKKVVDNFLILLVLKFHDHIPDSLRVILPASSLSGFGLGC
jgi:hypothetical protein